MEGIYEEQLNLQFEVVYQHVWKTADDPYTSRYGSELLKEMTTYWNRNRRRNYDLMHLWTGRSTFLMDDDQPLGE